VRTEELVYGREQAWQLLTEWTQSESLRKHALAVEACVAACGAAEADRLGLSGPEHAQAAGQAGRSLLHHCPAPTTLTMSATHAEEHPFVGVRELERLGWPAEMRTAILGHAQYSGVPRGDASGQGPLCLRRTGRLSDRLRPGEAEQGDCRCGSGQCAQEDEGQGLCARRKPGRRDPGRCRVGVDLDAHIGFCIEAMRRRAGELGLCKEQLSASSF